MKSDRLLSEKDCKGVIAFARIVAWRFVVYGKFSFLIILSFARIRFFCFFFPFICFFPKYHCFDGLLSSCAFQFPLRVWLASPSISNSIVCGAWRRSIMWVYAKSKPKSMHAGTWHRAMACQLLLPYSRAPKPAVAQLLCGAPKLTTANLVQLWLQHQHDKHAHFWSVIDCSVLWNITCSCPLIS